MVAAAVSSEYYVLSADIPVEAFPLFLSGRQYLAMLDATLPPADMFFRWAEFARHVAALCLQG
jgi:hypothetical protein